MVKLAILFATGLAALTGFASADNCKNGLDYCGYNLLKKGEQETQRFLKTLEPFGRTFQG